jgi:hypothetical protein
MKSVNHDSRHRSSLFQKGSKIHTILTDNGIQFRFAPRYATPE